MFQWRFNYDQNLIILTIYINFLILAHRRRKTGHSEKGTLLILAFTIIFLFVNLKIWRNDNNAIQATRLLLI